MNYTVVGRKDNQGTREPSENALLVKGVMAGTATVAVQIM
jgi:hypothetical protein